MKYSRLTKLTKAILISGFFKEVKNRAKDYASGKNNFKLGNLLNEVNEKESEVPANIKNQGFIQKIKTLSRMAKAFKAREYKEFPWKSIVLIIAGLIYFLSPIDFIPDILPILGFSDDAAIVFWIFNSLENEINKFIQWEQSKITIKIG